MIFKRKVFAGLVAYAVKRKAGLRELPCCSADRLGGLVVKASASGAEDPRFESRLRRDFSESSHTSDLKKNGTAVQQPTNQQTAVQQPTNQQTAVQQPTDKLQCSNQPTNCSAATSQQTTVQQPTNQQIAVLQPTNQQTAVQQPTNKLQCSNQPTNCSEASNQLTNKLQCSNQPTNQQSAVQVARQAGRQHEAAAECDQHGQQDGPHHWAPAAAAVTDIKEC